MAIYRYLTKFIIIQTEWLAWLYQCTIQIFFPYIALLHMWYNYAMCMWMNQKQNKCSIFTAAILTKKKKKKVSGEFYD